MINFKNAGKTALLVFLTGLISVSGIFYSCRGTQTSKQNDQEPSKINPIDSTKVEPKSDSSANNTSTDTSKSDQNGKPTPDNSKNDLKLSDVKQNRTYDDIARLIAGLKPDSGSGLDSLESFDAWKKHSVYFNANWSNIKKRRLAPMNQWGKTELADINSSGKDIFYPFSGADFMSVFSLFPNAKTYTMLALERPGALPNAGKMNEEQFSGYLNAVKTSLIDIFMRSFFVTRNMQKDLMKQNVNGTLPLISIFMVRTGCKILNIERVKVDKLGKIVNIPEDSANSVLNRGVRITFTPSKNSSDVRILYYFSLDLVDETFSKNKGMLTYLKGMGSVNSYIKSASYLLHFGNFSLIRNIILANSDHVLQDDSGISYAFYKKDIWDVKLYGSYEKPIAQFKHQVQKDLRDAYKDSVNVKALPFITGYHWGTKNPNLQLAVKKTHNNKN